jgi:hypothetical protein
VHCGQQDGQAGGAQAEPKVAADGREKASEVVQPHLDLFNCQQSLLFTFYFFFIYQLAGVDLRTFIHI